MIRCIGQVDPVCVEHSRWFVCFVSEVCAPVVTRSGPGSWPGPLHTSDLTGEVGNGLPPIAERLPRSVSEHESPIGIRCAAVEHFFEG
jgi:hypothetical protein